MHGERSQPQTLRLSFCFELQALLGLVHRHNAPFQIIFPDPCMIKS